MARIKTALANRRISADAVDADAAPAEAHRAAEIEALIATLRQQAPDMRRGANVSLTDLGVDDAFVPPLVAATRDADAYFRASAVHALADYDLGQYPQAESAVLHALTHDTEADVRAAAVLTLGMQSEAVAQAHLPACLQALKDPSAEVRREAVKVLGRWSSEPVVAALRARLHLDTDVDVRIWAIHALARCDTTNAMPDLVTATADLDGSVRAAALDALCECLDTEDTTLRDLLLAALSDPVAEVRRQAAQGLRFGPPQVLPALLAVANDPEPRVRLEVVIALGWQRDARAVDAIAARVFDEADEEVRYYAVSSLGEQRDARATQHLITAFETPELGHRVRWGALWALGDSGDLAAMPTLLAALRDPDAEFRAQAVESLRNLLSGAHADAEHAWPTLRPALMQSLRDDDDNVREQAARALTAIFTLPALHALLSSLPEHDIAAIHALQSAMAAREEEEAVATGPIGRGTVHYA
ncbi:HEAT repeat domain-containing protein [Ralstonia insidiosa]|nr:HEAT repeat domain-containing protein [Ralstonia insidiosa]MBY4909452.1 HEAT repeat domain-containing protein [Ralstonia insidiosa]